MTAIEFQTHYSEDLKNFLQTPAGKEFFGVLHSLRPAYESPAQEHLFIANREKIVGFEYCLRMILALTNAPVVQNQPEANYGVPDKQTKE